MAKTVKDNGVDLSKFDAATVKLFKSAQNKRGRKSNAEIAAIAKITGKPYKSATTARSKRPMVSTKGFQSIVDFFRSVDPDSPITVSQAGRQVNFPSDVAKGALAGAAKVHRLKTEQERDLTPLLGDPNSI
jgi:hypothetical protein